MATPVKSVCDLCQQECKGPIRYAHKPYVFHFYHEKQYKEALYNYEVENEETPSDVDNNNNNDNNNDNNSDNGMSRNDADEETEDDEKEVEGGEDRSDRSTSGDEEEEKDEREEEELNEDVSEGYYDEERQPLLGSEEEEEEEEEREEEEEVSDEDVDVDVHDTEEEGSENDDEEQMEERGSIEGDEKEDNDSEEEDIKRLLIPTPVITSILAEAKSTLDKSLDVTMATGVAIMAGIASMTSSNTSHIVLETVSNTCISTALGIVGIAAGVKELLNAIEESSPQLPLCANCKRCELQGAGCQSFCEMCGVCEKGSYWKDGSEHTHCLTICHNCNTNCVVCEANVATVKRHHKAFSKNVHGHLSARLYGTYREARVIGSSLIIAGILSCALPGMGWAWGLSLVAGSVIANTGIRIIAKPTVRIRCDTCNVEEEAECFEESTGCQRWCQCCGVLDETEGERYCLALCEECSDE